MLSREATNTNFIVFGLTRSGLEPTIYHTWYKQDNHYTINVFHSFYKKRKFLDTDMYNKEQIISNMLFRYKCISVDFPQIHETHTKGDNSRPIFIYNTTESWTVKSGSGSSSVNYQEYYIYLRLRRVEFFSLHV
jgi:hypothetical protein